MTDTKDKKDDKKPVEEAKPEEKKAPEAPKEEKKTEDKPKTKEETKAEVKKEETPKEEVKEEKTEKIEKEEVKDSKFTDIKPGQTVRVHQKIVQAGKERIQIFEGVVLAKKGKEDISRTITVRKISHGGFGVEKIFPLSSPLVPKVEIVNRPQKVRRSKLYYLRQSPRKIKELREKKQ